MNKPFIKLILLATLCVETSNSADDSKESHSNYLESANTCVQETEDLMRLEQIKNDPYSSRYTKLWDAFSYSDHFKCMDRFKALVVPNTELPQDLKERFLKVVPDATETEMFQLIYNIYEDEMNPSLVLCQPKPITSTRSIAVLWRKYLDTKYYAEKFHISFFSVSDSPLPNELIETFKLVMPDATDDEMRRTLKAVYDDAMNPQVEFSDDDSI